jgi:hypothetical protein
VRLATRVLESDATPRSVRRIGDGTRLTLAFVSATSAPCAHQRDEPPAERHHGADRPHHQQQGLVHHDGEHDADGQAGDGRAQSTGRRVVDDARRSTRPGAATCSRARRRRARAGLVDAGRRRRRSPLASPGPCRGEPTHVRSATRRRPRGGRWRARIRWSRRSRRSRRSARSRRRPDDGRRADTSRRRRRRVCRPGQRSAGAVAGGTVRAWGRRTARRRAASGRRGARPRRATWCRPRRDRSPRWRSSRGGRVCGLMRCRCGRCGRCRRCRRCRGSRPKEARAARPSGSAVSARGAILPIP